jgi:hypothetical protein
MRRGPTAEATVADRGLRIEQSATYLESTQ